jgi:histidinol-phosphatase (PHP family)
MMESGDRQSAERVRQRVSLHGGHTVAADGTATAPEMVRAAAEAGMEVFGCSEHFYRPREARFRWSTDLPGADWGRAGWPAYVDDVLACKATGQGPLRVLLGAEVEFYPGYEAWTREELARWPLEYVVLSVHNVVFEDGAVLPFDFTPRHWREAAERCGGPAALARRYYAHVLEALTWGVADVLGHLDVIKVFAPGPLEDAGVDALIDEVLARCAEAGVVLDLNARGLLKPCAEVYPSPAILRRAARAGVALITGDDSHAPEQVGLNLDRAAAVARAAGYEALHLPRRLGGTAYSL